MTSKNASLTGKHLSTKQLLIMMAVLRSSLHYSSMYVYMQVT